MKRFLKRIVSVDSVLLCLLVAVYTGKMQSGEVLFPVMQTEDARQRDIQKKKIALTFDDGPNADYTGILLEELKKRDVQATFFLLGKQAESEPDIVRQIKKDGHNIGNHSYEHVNLQNLSDEAAIEQVNKTNEVIYEITGEYPIFIRPPFGSWKSNLDYETDMIEVLWDIDPLDWNTHNADAVANRVIDKVEDNDIILLHDASKSSVEAAVKIVDELQKDGYEFVTVEELLFE
ncbi:MAG: polysaccharide deacetylase family protein [Lachnospiraceae bacterium]|nr:polysaccharide deacetylase family protein [Lachnospiraceae bacterium]